MNMPVPAVGDEAGPQWATDLVNCLTILDGHTHTDGSGVLITPDAININANLPFNGFSATTLLKASFSSQVSAQTGTNFLSFVGGNLYVNDGSGTQIAMTAAGGVAGTPGNIGSLASPASATYVAGNKKFVWQSGASKAAAMDSGALLIRETDVASANAVTLSSPSALASDYGITLLTALPVSTQALNITAAGNMGTITYDSIGSSMTSTGANAVAATRTRATGTSVGAGGVAISSSSGNFITTTDNTYTDVTNLSVTIVTSGRPICIRLVADGTSNNSEVFLSGTSFASNGILAGRFRLKRDSTTISNSTFAVPVDTTTGAKSISILPALSYIDAVAAGTYVYKLQVTPVQTSVTGLSLQINYCVLVVYEL